MSTSVPLSADGPGGMWAAKLDRTAYAAFDHITAAHARTLLAQLRLIPSEAAYPARAALRDGPWMRPAPPAGVDLSSLPAQQGKVRVLDNACGNGVVTIQLRSALVPALQKQGVEYTCADVHQAMVQRCQENMLERGWTDVKVQKEDAMATSFPPNSFDLHLTNFGYFAFPPLVGCAERAETFRLLVPGGLVGHTTWVTSGWVEDLGEALVRMGERRLLISDIWTKRGLGERWDDPHWVEQTMRQAGFENVTVTPHRGENVADAQAFVQEMVRAGMLAFAASMAGFGSLPPEEQEAKKVELARQLEIVVQERSKDGKAIHRMENLVVTAQKPLA